jgi:2-oxo-4-hydroxy-4-carboxy--5-ureidoimidazoline (OHCU) decarboxylase
MEDELEQLVRSIISENQERRVEWSAALGEITSALANGEEIANERLEEILDGLDTGTDDGGDTSGSDG